MIGADRQLDVVEYLDRHPGDAAGLGAAVDWEAHGWPAWALYEPIARAALANGAQIVAADLNEADKRAVFDEGAQALRARFVRRTGLDRDFPAALTSDLQAELHEANCGQTSPDVVRGMYQVQRARDAMMADRLAAASGKAGGILIAGNGHVRNDRGVPWYLARLEPGARTLSIGSPGGPGRPAAPAARSALRLRVVHAKRRRRRRCVRGARGRPPAAALIGAVRALLRDADHRRQTSSPSATAQRPT